MKNVVDTRPTICQIARVAESEQHEPNTTMKIAVINTMDRFDTIAGTVLSVHRSIEAAEKADAMIQRDVKRYNGRSSYLPTIIREVEPSVKKGDRIHESLIIA